jgi:periplasmic divalent cation tolerance protein
VKTNLIYITAGSEEEARAISKDLVQSRLAACVNIIDHMKSMYWWEGKIQEEREVILIAKTKESLVPELVERVKSIHSYEVPCIVSFQIADGNPSFLDWIAGETK